MKHRELVNHIEKRYSKLNQSLKRVILGFAANDIHLFRLEVKKLRSFLRLVSTTKRNESSLKLPKELHSIYNTLGVIRSLQLQQQSIEKLLPLEYARIQKPYLEFISGATDAYIVSVKTMVKKHTLSVGKRKILSRLSKGLKQKSIQKFITRKLNVLTTLMKPAVFSDISVHATRKVLKDILYTWSFTAKHKASPSVVIMSKKQIIEITKILGEFQNRCVRLDLMHVHYKPQQISTSERKLWRKLENKWWNEKENLRDEIHRLFLKSQPRYLDQTHDSKLRLGQQVKFLSSEMVIDNMLAK